MDNKYKYTYEKTADYCYKDTDDLKNIIQKRFRYRIFHFIIKLDIKYMKN